MRTTISPELLTDPEVKVSEQVLRACVHCGFCNATCPTYQLTGNELEGPRGRIYLIKNILEGEIKIEDGKRTVAHIDSCLGCLSCETTCPSGVNYSHLLDEARLRIEREHRRSFVDRLTRGVLTRVLTHPGRLRTSLRLAGIGRLLKSLIPSQMRRLVEMAPTASLQPTRIALPGVIPAEGKRRARMALLTGCAQQVLGPQINDATVRLLTRLGVEIIIPKEMGCCGALTFHMGEQRHSLQLMQNNIEVWHREMEEGGLDAIVINTSGCGAVIRDYGHIFRNDPQWAERAQSVAALVRDVSEVVVELGLGEIENALDLRVAYHDACSLQHGQKIKEAPRLLLEQAGFEVVEVPEGHLCCGSAGTYNMLQPRFAEELLKRKTENIERVKPQVVAAGNIGCIEQLQQGLHIPVVHTVELLDWATGGPKLSELDR